MLVWLNTYLNWWDSQAGKFIEMTLFDFLVSIPLAFVPFVPFVILFWPSGGFKKRKLTKKPRNKRVKYDNRAQQFASMSIKFKPDSNNSIVFCKEDLDHHSRVFSTASNGVDTSPVGMVSRGALSISYLDQFPSESEFFDSIQDFKSKTLKI